MRRIALVPATMIAALLAAAPASATTFCVPDFHPACPNNGTNVKQTNLETALNANGSDGQADKVIIGPHIYTDADSLQATGTDGLEIVGAGPGDTVITSSSANNIYVFDLNGRGQPQSVRDLRIVIPSSFPDGGGNGAAAQVKNATFDHVEVESRNPQSTGIYFNTGGILRDSVVHGTTGSIYYGVTANAAGPGTVTVERSTVETVGLGISAEVANIPVTVRRSTISGFTGVSVKNGDSVALSDSLLTVTGSAISVGGGAAGTSSATARNVTIVGLSGDTQPALVATGALAPSTGSANVTVSDSIIRGFPATWNRQAAAANIIAGNATVSLDHSNFPPNGSSAGDGSLILGAGNLDADPLFAGPSDYRLTAGSPSLDASDPTVAIAGDGLDLAGLPREANATGKAQTIRDQGAYEFQPPPPPGAGGTGATGTPSSPPPGGPVAARDTTRPTITGLKLVGALTGRAGGRVKLKLSEAAAVTLTFTRKAGKAKPVRVRVTFKGRRAGTNTLRVKAGRLPAGRWTLSAVAVDAAGNRSKAVTRLVRVAR